MSGEERLIVPEHRHILAHGSLGNMPVFSDKDERERAVAQLRAMAKHHDMSVHSYIVLKASFMLMAYIEDKEQVSAFMKSLSRQFTEDYNRRHGHRGSLWKSHFHSAPIEPGDHELRVMRYIERKPVLEKLSRTANQYPHSSFAERLRNPKDRWMDDPQCYLDLGATDQERLIVYREYIKAGPDAIDTVLIEGALAHGSLVGSKYYARKLGLLDLE